ncbi:MAG: efflux RND transporter permease subunit, partial [Burkholderiaceae bacterium]
DAIVDVENIIRRLRMNNLTQVTHRLHPLEVVRRASLEVRSGILYATVIIVLVFFPLFFLPGIEGRLFVPLGIAFIASTLASLLVSVTITPVLAYYLIPSMKSLDDGDTTFLTWLKRQYASILERVMHRPERALRTGLLGVVIAIAAVPFFPTSFLPPFNEGTLLLGLRLNPGVTLSQSSVIASEAERLVAKVPEVAYVGRRSGRAELDEHAEGVHVSEIDIGLIPSHEMTRSMTEIKTDIREQLRNIPAAISIGQPISHRIDHMLSGVRAQIAIKIYGEDLDQLRAQAESLRASLAQVPGIADLEVEKQVLAPQIKIRVDQQRAAQYGLSSAHLTSVLQSLVGGETLAQIVEQGRRFALVVRIPEAARGPQGLGNLMIDTPQGRVPLSRLAEIEESDGPNQISRDDGKRRIVLSANTQGRALSSVVEDIRKVTSQVRLPEGFYITIGGQFEAQERASRLVMLLSIVSLVLMFVVLHARYKSWRLSALVMANIPLALVGSVIGLAASGQPLSIAALIGFVTLAGISVRNGILKVSHYLNLMQQEGERFDKQMILRGSLERLAPVLMTALVTALALAPLLFEAEQPGTEILHPVAVVIFCGLLSATLLDSFLTPVMFWMYGRADAERLIRENESENF